MDSLTPELYMVGPNEGDDAKETMKKSASELFAEDILRGAIERSRRKAPHIAARMEKLAQPTIGESIFRVLRKEPLGEEELEEQVKKMSGNLYHPRFFKSVVSGYLKEGYIKCDEETGLYSLNLNHRLFSHLR